MERDFSTEDVEQSLDQILGYLNFSSGGPDAKVSRALNKLGRIYSQLVLAEPSLAEKGAIGSFAARLQADLTQRLEAIAQTSAAFQNPQQARDVLSAV